MATIIELTLNKSSLNNILKSIIINSDSDSVNTACKDIIARDIVNFKPSYLTHCYNLKELILALETFLHKDFTTKLVREIIPNKHDLGIVREVMMSPSELTNENYLKQLFYNKYRYYIFLQKDNLQYVLTYNPEVKYKRQVRVILDENSTAYCQTMQTHHIELSDKLKQGEIQELFGTYITYTIN